MTELTQQQIDALIQEINEAEDPESVTNGMVATVLDYLNERHKAGRLSLGELVDTISAIQTSINSLQTGLSGVSGNFESIDDRKTDKNIQTGRLTYPQAPVVVLASMGQELDSVGKSSPVAHVASAGDYIWDANNGIQYYKSIDDVKQIGLPQRGIVYTNAHSNRQYRWNGTTWLQVGGNDIEVLDTLNSGATNKPLSANRGRELYTRSLVVIDIMEYNYCQDGDLDIEDVPDEGLLCFCVDDLKLRFFYKTQVEPTQQGESSTLSVANISFDPDVHIMYYDYENGRVIKWSGLDWETVSAGTGGVSIRLTGTRAIFTASQGGGGITDDTPTLTVTPTSINFGDVENGKSKSLTFVVKGNHLTDDVEIMSIYSHVTFDQDVLQPVNGRLNGAQGILVTVTYTASQEGTGSVTDTIQISSTGAETKTISVSATDTEQIVPKIYTNESDDTSTTGSVTLTGPLSTDNNVDAAFLNGKTGTVRIYVKNIEGTITASLTDENEVLSLDDGSDVAERVVEQTLDVSEHTHVDIPLRFIRQATIGTTTAILVVTYGDPNNGGAQATITINCTTVARKTSGTIYTDASQHIYYCFSGGQVAVYPSSDWNSVYNSNNKAIIKIASTVVDNNGYQYTGRSLGLFRGLQFLDILDIPKEYNNRTDAQPTRGTDINVLVCRYDIIHNAQTVFSGNNSLRKIKTVIIDAVKVEGASTTTFVANAFTNSGIDDLYIKGYNSPTVYFNDLSTRFNLVTLTQEYVDDYNDYHSRLGDGKTLSGEDVNKTYVGYTENIDVDGTAKTIPVLTTLHYNNSQYIKAQYNSGKALSDIFKFTKQGISEVDDYLNGTYS